MKEIFVIPSMVFKISPEPHCTSLLKLMEEEQSPRDLQAIKGGSICTVTRSRSQSHSEVEVRPSQEALLQQSLAN